MSKLPHFPTSRAFAAEIHIISAPQVRVSHIFTSIPYDSSSFLAMTSGEWPDSLRKCLDNTGAFTHLGYFATE